MGRREGHELAGDDPVHVAVLDLLVELVLAHVKGVHIEPVHLHAELEPAEAVQDRALVGAGQVGGVPEGQEVHTLEGLPGLVGGFSHVDHLG